MAIPARVRERVRRLHGGRGSLGLTVSMTPDRELWASAIEIINKHGCDAGIHAAMKADALLEAGEIDGALTWQRILSRVNELQRDAPAILQ